jgi:S1-C subfamily serine protease
VNKHIIWNIAICAALTGGGCASHPKTAADGQAVFGALQQAAATAGKKVEPSLALVTIERSGGSPRSSGGGFMPGFGGGSGGSLPLTGVVVTAKGHVLVPTVLKPDQDSRITVLVGENEYVGQPLKSDDTLGMTIIKVDSDHPFTPLDLSKGADLTVGEWALVLRPTDENLDYQKLESLLVCQGEKSGRYRRFLLSQSLTGLPGAMVVNLSGQVIGIADKGTVLCINDMRDDLKRFIADATGSTTHDFSKQQKGWFGALLEPLNKDYAEAKGLTVSSLVVVFISKDSPAAAAGLRSGDLIVGINGKPLRLSGNRLADYFTQSLHPQVGEKFTLSVMRNGKTLELSSTFTKVPERATMQAEDLGVTVAGIMDSDAFLLNLPTGHGVLVTDVIRGSPAANSGNLRQTLISRGDVIVELAGQPTPDIESFKKVLETIRHDEPPVVLIKYYRGMMTGYAGLNLALGVKDNGDKQ